jgi:hypothetical protein
MASQKGRGGERERERARERESDCMISGQLRKLQLCESIVTVHGIHQQQEELNG